VATIKSNAVFKMKEGLSPFFDSVNILLTALVALSIFRLIHQSIKFLLTSSFIDLAYHYFYSSMVRLNLNPFDPASIEIAKNIIPLRYAGGQAVYPPSYFYFFQNLTHIPFSILSALWLGLSLVLIFITIIILAKNIKADTSLIALAFVIVIVGNYQPLYEDLVLGQNNCLLLFCSVVAWYGIKNNNDWVSGPSIAFIAFIKIQFGLLFLFFIIAGKKRALLISAIFFFLLEFAGFLKLGLGFYKNYIFALFQHTSNVSIDIYNISFNGQLHKLFGNNPNFAIFVYFVASLTLVFLLYFKVFKHKKYIPLEYIFLIIITTVPLLSPHTEEHHLVVLLLPIIWVSLNIYQANHTTKLLFLLSILLLVSRYSFARYAENTSQWLYPLLCLKSVGALFLLFTLLGYSKKEFKFYKSERLI
jgi:hypothetical protein